MDDWDDVEEEYLVSDEPPRIFPEFVFHQIKPTTNETGPQPIEEEPYCSIKVLVDGVNNDSPHPQVRYSMVFSRKDDVPYLFYSYRENVYKINLEKCKDDDSDNNNLENVEKIWEDISHFFLSKHSNKFFELFSGELRVFDLETKEKLFESILCYNGGSFNSIAITRDEKRLFSVAQNDHFCIYDLNEEKKKISLLSNYDLHDYGNQITISKDEKWISLVTDDVGGFIFRYDRNKNSVKRVANNVDYLRKYWPHFEEHFEDNTIGIRGQSNFSDFNCDSTRCVICTGHNLSIFRLIDDADFDDDDAESTQTYLEVFVNVQIVYSAEEEDEGSGMYYGGTSSHAKYSPTNPDILVFTKSCYSSGYISDHKAFIFKHGSTPSGKKSQIIRCLDLPSYEHHFGTLPLLEDPTEVESKEEGGEEDNQEQEEDEFAFSFNRDEFNSENRNFHIYSCEFHDDGRSLYISLNMQSKETSKFLKLDLKEEFWGLKSSDVEGNIMHRKDLRERIEFLNNGNGEDETISEHFNDTKKIRIKWGLGQDESVVAYVVFLLI